MSFPEFLLVADDLDGNAFRAALSDEGGAEGKNLENCLGEYSREDLMCFFGQMRSGTVGDVNVPIFANTPLVQCLADKFDGLDEAGADTCHSELAAILVWVITGAMRVT